MKASLDALLGTVPQPGSAQWPEGIPFARAMAHGTMSVEVFAPLGVDHQQPHDQDEIYIVVRGQSGFERNGERLSVQAGDCLFVPAGMPHRFVDIGPDFVTWVVFWGPMGGERA